MNKYRIILNGECESGKPRRKTDVKRGGLVFKKTTLLIRIVNRLTKKNNK